MSQRGGSTRRGVAVTGPSRTGACASPQGFLCPRVRQWTPGEGWRAHGREAQVGGTRVVQAEKAECFLNPEAPVCASQSLASLFFLKNSVQEILFISLNFLPGNDANYIPEPELRSTGL